MPHFFCVTSDAQIIDQRIAFCRKLAIAFGFTKDTLKIRMIGRCVWDGRHAGQCLAGLASRILVVFWVPAVFGQDKPNIFLVCLDKIGWGEPGFQ